jgi:hypothetical protein
MVYVKLVIVVVPVADKVAPVIVGTGFLILEPVFHRTTTRKTPV